MMEIALRTALKRFGWTSLITLFCGFALLIGCSSNNGPPRGEVTGEVTMDKEAIQEGSISFVPSEGTRGPVTGGMIKNGTYSISDGVPVGSYRVEIRANKKTGRMIPSIPPAPPDSKIEETVSITPPKFNSESTLTGVVKEGVNKIDFHLSSKDSK